MAKKKTYFDYLRQEMGDLIDQLDLSDLHKQSLKRRWLDQVVWADKKADQCRRMHYRLRGTTIVGGVILPALVGLNFQLAKENEILRTWFPYVPFVLSQVIAVSAAAEEFFRYGDRWREYRQLSEDLKAEGWQFLQLSGPYQYKPNQETIELPPPPPRAQIAAMPVEEWKALKVQKSTKHPTTHREIFSLFTGRVESLIQSDVQSYITALQQKQAKEEQDVQKLLGEVKAVADDTTLFARPAPASPAFAPNSPPVSNYAGGDPSGMGMPPNGYGGPLPAYNAPGVTPPAPFVATAPSFTAPVAPQAAPVTPSNGTASPEIPVFVPSAAPIPPLSVAPIAAPPTPPVPVAVAPVAPPASPPIAAPVADLNAAIVAAATKLRGMSTAEGPDGGNNACGWTVNKVLQEAGIAPIGENPNYVPSVVEALQGARGQAISRDAAKAGDLVIAAGEAHIGIGMTDGCTTVLSNSSSRARFQWESDLDFDGSYGGTSTIYRLLQ